MLYEQVHFNDMESLIALSKTPEGLSLIEENVSAWMKKIYEVGFLLKKNLRTPILTVVVFLHFCSDLGFVVGGEGSGVDSCGEKPDWT